MLHTLCPQLPVSSLCHGSKVLCAAAQPALVPPLQLCEQRAAAYSRATKHRCCSSNGLSAADGCEPSVTRRVLLGSGILAVGLASTPLLTAQAQLTLADVTPPIVDGGPLPPREAAIVDVFERTSTSVVNVVDLALQGRAYNTPDVDVVEGNGTGFVWDTQGHIVTNWHVLQASLSKQGAKPGTKVAAVTITSPDGTKQAFPATLSGADRLRDLAVVRVEAPQDILRPLVRGATGQLRVGQQCLAIGNPFGFDKTLTTGVVSALNRDIRSQLTGLVIPGGIQTDAAINPGNSGGPLLDSAGRLVGVNTQIFTSTGASVGLGFAIPSEVVERVVPQLVEYGRVLRPSLQVQFAADSVTQKLGVARGAMIQGVVSGGAAARVGLLPLRRSLGGIVPGDVVVAVDGVGVRSAGELLDRLDRFSPGAGVRLAVQRYSDAQAFEELQVEVVLGQDS